MAGAPDDKIGCDDRLERDLSAPNNMVGCSGLPERDGECTQRPHRVPSPTRASRLAKHEAVAVPDDISGAPTTVVGMVRAPVNMIGRDDHPKSDGDRTRRRHRVQLPPQPRDPQTRSGGGRRQAAGGTR
ncbi:hypothetical protein Acsp01_04730 [Actinoplanes sp. NBRC 101535]|nr:hypothetical protein Acsp01_04730 [Actinoplanes sp. NBRC 101535]